MALRVFNVLFLCTGNSVRSIIAEAYLNGLLLPHLKAFSAGSAPLGEVHPLAVKVLEEAGIPTDNLRSKSWNEYLAPNAPQMDMVIDLREDPRPEWPGKPVMANWAVPDPAMIDSGNDNMRAASAKILAYLKQRTDFLQHFDENQLANLADHVGGSAKGAPLKD
jgi:arsenate reductase